MKNKEGKNVKMTFKAIFENCLKQNESECLPDNGEIIYELFSKGTSNLLESDIFSPDELASLILIRDSLKREFEELDEECERIDRLNEELNRIEREENRKKARRKKVYLFLKKIYGKKGKSKMMTNEGGAS